VLNEYKPWVEADPSQRWDQDSCISFDSSRGTIRRTRLTFDWCDDHNPSQWRWVNGRSCPHGPSTSFILGRVGMKDGLNPGYHQVDSCLGHRRWGQIVRQGFSLNISIMTTRHKLPFYRLNIAQRWQATHCRDRCPKIEAWPKPADTWDFHPV